MAGTQRLLGAIAGCYAAAFASNWLQWPGLFGEDGIDPVSARVKAGPDGNLGDTLLGESETKFEAVKMIMWTTGINEAGLLCETCCLAGLVVSILAMIPGDKFKGPSSFFLMWVLYLAIQQVGRTFLSFQWDMLLLETGFISIFASLQVSPSLTAFAYRFVFFKLMFMSGVVKVQSHCPTWLGLTALNYHYASQCIPTPAAWFAHQLPTWLQRLSVLATLLIEIPCTFWILSPFYVHRMASVAVQTLLQVLIMITGNYNFFNLLTLSLCFAQLLDGDQELVLYLLDSDATLSKSKVWQYASTFFRSGRLLLHSFEQFSFGKFLLLASSVCLVGWYAQEHMAELIWDIFHIEFPARLKHNFAKELDTHVHYLVAPLWYFCAFQACSSAILDVSLHFVALMGSRRFGRVVGRMVGVTLSIATCLGLLATLSVSFVPLAALDQRGGVQQVVPRQVIEAYFRAARVGGISNGYGLFRSMTGVNPTTGAVARPEVVIQFKRSVDSSWEDLEFLYKPGALDRAPRFIWPFQPRIDWQMWFAALSSYQHAPWLVQLCDKILRNSPDVMRLVQGKHDPSFQIVSIRAILYHYDFTRVQSLDRPSKGHPVPDDRYNTSNWWWRLPNSEREYLPPIYRGEPSVQQFLDAHGLRSVPSTSHQGAFVKSWTVVLNTLRFYGQHSVEKACSTEFTVGLFLFLSILRATGRRNSVHRSSPS